MLIGHFTLKGPEFNPKKKYNIYMKYQIVTYKKCSAFDCQKKHYKSGHWNYETITSCKKCSKQLLLESINEKLVIEITRPYGDIIDFAGIGRILCSMQLMKKKDKYGRIKFFGMMDKPKDQVLISAINAKYGVFEIHTKQLQIKDLIYEYESNKKQRILRQM